MSRKSSKSKSKGKRRSIFVSPFVLLALLPLIAAVLFARTGSLDRILTVWRNLGKTPESKSAQREETRKREPLKKKRRADERIRPDGTKPSGVAASTGHASEAVVRAGVDASGSVDDALDDPDDETTACDDKQDVCKFWAEIGECETNPGYMKVHCAKSCKTCHMRDYRKRCVVDPSILPSVPPGAMNVMFERLLTDPQFEAFKPTALSSSPYVIQLDAFLSEEESTALIAQGQEKGFIRSEDAGAMREDGSMTPIQSLHRTSHTAWCDNKLCLADELIQKVMLRAEDMTMVPQNNSEFVQILQYSPGQYYGKHHDFIDGQLKLPCGPRVYTLFMYLSDVEGGGETEFYDLGIKVTPKRGRAILWPSTFSDKPSTQDRRTMHEALPVTAGLKYGANLWIHQHDFRAAHRLGCTG